MKAPLETKKGQAQHVALGGKSMIANTCMTELTSKLLVLGFNLIPNAMPNSKFTFVRKRLSHAFERIVCEFIRKKNDAAVCWIGVSLTHTIPFKGLTENLLVEEVASDTDRGWTIIKSKDDLSKWLQSVAEIAVPKLNQIAAELAKTIVGNCEESLERAKSCIVAVERVTSVEAMLLTLKANATEDERRVAERIVEWPGVVQLADSRTTYEVATLLVLQNLYKSRLPNPLNTTEMPLENTNLMREIQLVADSLLQSS